jgi:hypothetical protein
MFPQEVENAENAKQNFTSNGRVSLHLEATRMRTTPVVGKIAEKSLIPL